MVSAGSYSVFVWEFGSPEVWAGEIRVLGFFRTWWGFGGVCVATTGSSGCGGVRKRNNKMATWDEELGKQAVDPKWTSVWSHGSLRFLLWPSFGDGISGNFFAILLFFILSLFSLFLASLELYLLWCLGSGHLPMTTTAATWLHSFVVWKDSEVCRFAQFRWPVHLHTLLFG
jgi:hypothetical protein